MTREVVDDVRDEDEDRDGMMSDGRTKMGTGETAKRQASIPELPA